MAYEFNERVWNEWSWVEMVAQLDDQSIAHVVKGDRSSGFVKACWFAQRPNSYDHKRHRQPKAEGRPQTNTQLRVWDFVIVRDDDSCIRLHPQWSTTAVDVAAGVGHEEEIVTPSTGLGGSEGPGTYKYYKEVGVEKKLKFDAWKVPPHLKSKGEGKKKGKTRQ